MENDFSKNRREIDDGYRRLSVRDFRENMADALNFASFERKPIVLTKNGEERVGIVPLEYVWFIDQLSKKIDIDWLVLKNRTSEMMWDDIKAVLQQLSENQLPNMENERNEPRRSNRDKVP